MDAHGAGADRVPVASDILRNEADAYRKTLVGLDLGRPDRSGGEQRVRIWTIGALLRKKR